MEPPLHVPTLETTPVWTNEKHVNFLNTMEASFVRTMLHRCGGSTHLLRLDRPLPDSSESTLDLKPRRSPMKHAPSDSMGRRARMVRKRMKRRSSQLHNSSQEQVVPQLEDGREGAACIIGDDDKEQRSNV